MEPRPASMRGRSDAPRAEDQLCCSNGTALLVERVDQPLPLDAKIFVAGARGLVGSALLRRLQQDGFTKILTPTRAQLDLTDPTAVHAYFAEHRPHYVLLAAAKVGGILANRAFPADFARDNLLIATHVIHASWQWGVKKLLFLGSSCIYPKLAPQPIPESALLGGHLEATNEAYAVAKIAGIALCQAYRRQYGLSAIALMPTNLYGPGDNFHPEHSHVVPGLLRRFHEAAQLSLPNVTAWGTGNPRRELLHVDDLADACLFAMRHYDGASPLNVGWGIDHRIAEIAEMIRKVTGYHGDLLWDSSKPDGTPQKLLDTTAFSSLGWRPRVLLDQGLSSTYDWFRKHSAWARVSAASATSSATLRGSPVSQ